jgi:hypothetical protein
MNLPSPIWPMFSGRSANPAKARPTADFPILGPRIPKPGSFAVDWDGSCPIIFLRLRCQFYNILTYTR